MARKKYNVPAQISEYDRRKSIEDRERDIREQDGKDNYSEEDRRALEELIDQANAAEDQSKYRDKGYKDGGMVTKGKSRGHRGDGVCTKGFTKGRMY